MVAIKYTTSPIDLYPSSGCQWEEYTCNTNEGSASQTLKTWRIGCREGKQLTCGIIWSNVVLLTEAVSCCGVRVIENQDSAQHPDQVSRCVDHSIRGEIGISCARLCTCSATTKDIVCLNRIAFSGQESILQMHTGCYHYAVCQIWSAKISQGDRWLSSEPKRKQTQDPIWNPTPGDDQIFHCAEIDEVWYRFELSSACMSSMQLRNKTR